MTDQERIEKLTKALVEAAAHMCLLALSIVRCPNPLEAQAALKGSLLCIEDAMGDVLKNEIKIAVADRAMFILDTGGKILAQGPNGATQAPGQA